MTLQEIKNYVEQEKGKMQQIKDDINAFETKIAENQKRLLNLEKASEIVKLVSLMTQEELQYHISDITSLALSSVFPEPYNIVLDFVERRNKTECDILFEKDGNRIKPIDASGGGAVDIASFALRIASWCMAKPRSRNVIILDEPMRYVSAEYQYAASEMIKQVSKKLGIQFIIITHNTVLASYADKTFQVSKKRNKSIVKEI